MNPLNFATAQLVRVLPRAGISRVMGRLADVQWSPALGRAVVDLYCRAYDVRLDECLQRDGFSSFDQFFTRELVPGARPIDGDERVVVSPADGRIESLGPVDGKRTFVVKGRPYRVEELLGSEDEARRYEGGVGFVVYLSPRDYHRVHAPVAGTIAEIRSMPGDFFPVNEVGLRYVPNLFARNRRVSIAIDTAEPTGLGRVSVVMVAAMVVGRITVAGVDDRDVPLGHHKFDRGLSLARGDELGMFHLGSTAVVFLERRAIESWLRFEGPVRMGEAIARAPAAPSQSDRSDGRG